MSLMKFWKKRREEGIRIREFRVILDSAFHYRKCHIVDNETEAIYEGRVVNLSKGGLCVATQEDLPVGKIMKITFWDQVKKLNIKVSIRILAKKNASLLFKIVAYARNLIWRIFRSDYAFVKQFRCECCVDLLISKNYDDYVERVLSDSYVNELSGRKNELHNHVPRFLRRDNTIAFDKVEFKIAETAQEKEMAYRLLYKEYLRKGITNPNEHGIYVRFYQLLPSSTTFIGVMNGQVLMTLTSFNDSPLGLPMDKRFHDILQPLREQNRRLVECGMLALDHELCGTGAYALKHFKKMSALFSLFRFAMRHAMRVYGSTDIVIGIFDWYKKLYGYLSFEPMGEKAYYAENNDWIYPFRLNLKNAARKDFVSDIGRLTLMHYFFKTRVNERKFYVNIKMSEEDIHYLFVEKSHLLEGLSDEELRKLRKYYPAIGDAVFELLTSERRKAFRPEPEEAQTPALDNSSDRTKRDVRVIPEISTRTIEVNFKKMEQKNE